jgi:hypothetical protein
MKQLSDARLEYRGENQPVIEPYDFRFERSGVQEDFNWSHYYAGVDVSRMLSTMESNGMRTSVYETLLRIEVHCFTPQVVGLKRDLSLLCMDFMYDLDVVLLSANVMNCDLVRVSHSAAKFLSVKSGASGAYRIMSYDLRMF